VRHARSSIATALATLFALASIGSATAAPWTYRGTLNDGGKPAQGQYDLRLTLLDDGHALTQPLTLFGVLVNDGNFAVEVDFGVDLSQAAPLQLRTEVQRSDQSGGGFVALGEPTRFDAKAALGGICWDTLGNAGTNSALNFIGTTDNQPLVLRTQNVQSLRIEPSTSTFNGDPITANVIAGGSANAVLADATGATISGGGQVDGSPNRVAGSFGSIGGGLNNLIGDPLGNPLNSGIGAVIGGGQSNTATGPLGTISGGGSNAATQFGTTVGGGQNNLASGDASTVAGGRLNTASGGESVVGGGVSNCAGGSRSWAGGARAKVRPGSGSGSAGAACEGVPTSASSVGDEGTFVWADSQPADFISTAPNQFLVRATAGFGLNTTIPTPSHLTIGKDDGSNNTVALGYFGDVTRWRISGPDAGNGSAFEVQSGGNQVLLRVEDVGASSRVGISRTATVNALEVEGNASKTTAGSWVANSDARIKTEVEEIDGALAQLMTVRPVTFRYTPEYRAEHPGIADQRYYNVIAQEFAESFPDAVKGSGEFLPGEKSAASEILQVDVHPALITAIAAIQELVARQELLEARIRELETERAR
jgi:hypothetical protein